MRPLHCAILLGVLVAASPAAAQAVPILDGVRVVGGDTDAGDKFGSCAAIADVPVATPQSGLPAAGPLALGGAPGVPPDNAAYLFRTRAAEWTQAQRIVPDQGGFFGRACALSADGSLVLVGAPAREAPPAGGGMYPGTAHLFRYDAISGLWGGEAVLRVADLAASSYFGQSVAVARDGAGAAATEERLLALGGGRAWVMRRMAAPDSAWAEEGRLEPEAGSSDTFQGLAANYGTPHQRAAIARGFNGAWRAMAGGPYTLDGTYRGSAYLWRLDTTSGAWVREARFAGASNGTCLGHSVALAEAGGVWLAAAGATQGCVGGGVGTGYVVVWRFEPGAGVGAGVWVEEARLTVPEGGLADFGYAVALSAGPGGAVGGGGPPVLVASAWSRTGASSPPVGAFVFVREPAAGGGVTWRPVAKLRTATAASPNGSGWSVGASGAAAAVGHPEEDTAGMDAGALFAYDLTGVLTAGEPGPVSAALALAAPAPHPVRGAARLSYSLPVASDVRLMLYDALGRAVWRHAAPAQSAGAHQVALDAGALAAGVYVLRLEAGGAVAMRRVVVAR